MEAPRVVLITGASSGLGLAQGRLLAARGFRVYGTARNPQNYPGFDAFPLLPLDVCDEASVAVSAPSEDSWISCRSRTSPKAVSG